MKLYQQEGPKEEVIRLIKAVGIQKAAAELNMSVENLETAVELIRYKYDSEYFSSERLRITNKHGSLVPLLYNKGQRTIAEAIETQRKTRVPVRICLLKARQFGGSTEFEAELFKDSILRSNRSSMVIAHDLDSARHLRDMTERFYDNYELTRPRIKRESEKWWKFLHFDEQDKRAYSHFRIDTAEELSTGHSLTLHNLHLSEIQNWRNASVLVKGLFPTVPTHPDTMIFMEGTGSGVGDFWYDFCQVAQDPASGWAFVFVPWYDIEDYTLRFPTEERRNEFEAKLTQEERLFYTKGVTLEQLYWRRTVISDQYKGDVDGFRQQYPSDPDEAFLTSGRPVFSMMKVKENIARAKKGKIGVLEWREGRKKVAFNEQERGLWEMWEETSEKGENMYCLGADVAEGISVVPELGTRGGDKSSAKVFRRDKKVMVARLNAHIDPDHFAEELHKASVYWGTALLVENNPGGSGNVVIRDLKDIPEVSLLKTVTLDKIHDIRKEQYGWDTNKESKREMVDELVEQIRDNSFLDNDKEFWYQCSTYVRDEKGRTNAQSRKFDDEVIAVAIALQADKMLPRPSKPEVGSEKKPITRDMDVPQNRKGDIPLRDQIMEDNYAVV